MAAGFLYEVAWTYIACSAHLAFHFTLCTDVKQCKVQRSLMAQGFCYHHEAGEVLLQVERS